MNTIKKRVLAEIREQLSKTEIPKVINFEYMRITNPALFFNSHLSIVEHNDKGYEVYADRLKKVLKSIGIDVLEITKKIQNGNTR